MSCVMNICSHVRNGMLSLLHIDDSSIERLLVKEAVSLTKTPFDFYEASGIESAMAFFHVHPRNGAAGHRQPAVVLLDYDLGEERGTDFLYWLRVLKGIRSIPVVMFSGSCEKVDVQECYASGADYFVNKPASLARIKSVVQALFLSVSFPTRQPSPLSLLPEYVADATLQQTANVTADRVLRPCAHVQPSSM